MTNTMEQAAEVPDSAAEGLAHQLRSAESTADVAAALKASGAVDGLLAQIDGGELQLTGEGGLLSGLLKLALERGLQAELTDHLGYDKGDPAGREVANSRNGSTPKTLQTEVGPVELAVPRDRDGSFTPRLVPKGQRRLGGLDDMIISLYAGGMTQRDIQFHLNSVYGTEISPETISKIVDEISEAVLTWQNRPLEALYPVIYLDAIMVKVKDGGHPQQGGAHRRRRRYGRDQARPGHLGAADRRCLVLGRGLREPGQPRGP